MRNRVFKYNIFLACLTLGLLAPMSILFGQSLENFKVAPSELTQQKYGEYDKLAISGFGYTDEIGNPELPAQIVSFVLPIDAVVTGITINSVTKSKLNGSFLVFPTQPPIATDSSNVVPFVQPNTKVYDSSTPYPEKMAEIIEDGMTHGYHVVTLKVYPVEYLPKNREIYLRDITLTINYTTSTLKSASVVKKKVSFSSAEIGANYIKSSVRNNQKVTEYRDQNSEIIPESNNLNGNQPANGLKSLSVTQDLVPDYFIITNAALKPTFALLAEWKTKKGVPTTIKTVEEIAINYPGSDLQEKIRNYITEVSLKYGTSKYILIGGDVNIVPARNYGGYVNNGIQEIVPSDLYYSNVSNVAWMSDAADVFLGRASVENIAEAQTFVNKVINYEKFKDVNSNNIANSNYTNNILYILPKFNGDMQDHYDYLTKAAPNYSSSSTLKQWFLNEMNANVVMDKPNIMQCLTGGSSVGNFQLTYHMSHGSSSAIMSTQIPQSIITLSDIDGMTNGAFPQIFFSGSCNPADFKADCFAEHYINNPNGGGVAFIGNSDNGFFDEYDEFEIFCSYLYGNSSKKITSLYNNLCYLYQHATNESNARNQASIKYRQALIGDPEMPVWSKTPSVLQVAVTPSVITSGNNTIVVSVSNLPVGQEAKICLYKKDEGYATQTIYSNGDYPFYFTPNSAGDVSVTVTSRDCIPNEKTIKVNPNLSNNLFISDITIDDDKTGASIGNGDKQIDAGETVELTIDLKNSGLTTASNISAKLSTNYSAVTILDNVSSFANIGAGAIASSTLKYRFKVDANAMQVLSTDPNPQVLFLEITVDGTTYIRSFNIDIFAPKLLLSKQTIVSTSDGDMQIEPGEEVQLNIELFNGGLAECTGITATLSSINGFSTFTSPTSTYLPISKLATGKNSAVFTFKAAPDFNASSAQMKLVVTTEFGQTNDAGGKETGSPHYSFNFNPTDAPSKINATSIKNTPTSTSIALNWTGINGIPGYNIYRSDANDDGSDKGNYLKCNTFLVTSTNYTDYNLEPLTVYYYKVVAVSASMNEAPTDAVPATTTYQLSNLFPVTMNVGRWIRSAIIAEDVDQDGQKEIFSSISDEANRSFILGLRANGTEMFNIDNNVTTYSGFAELAADIMSAPAIGDLKNNGQFAIVSNTRRGVSDMLYAHVVTDSNSDASPDFVWQPQPIDFQCFRSPILANLDNSADGSLETVTFGDNGGINILSSIGTRLATIPWVSGVFNVSAAAVADLDGDGDLEIIRSEGSSIYAWHRNGDMLNGKPLYTSTDFQLTSSITVCDLDMDGRKEILTAGVAPAGNVAKIIAVHGNDGTPVLGWEEGTHTFSIGTIENWRPLEISVGDLNNDKKLEVVCLTKGAVKVWDNIGNLLLSQPVPTLTRGTAILADVDGNTKEIEIIFTTGSEIHAIGLNGKEVKGFPLTTAGTIEDAVCVADVNGNGKSEIIAGAPKQVYMWETNGNPKFIEWGSGRFNCRNTGNYSDVIPPLKPVVNYTATTLNFASTDADAFRITYLKNDAAYKTLDVNASQSIEISKLSLESGINHIKVQAIRKSVVSSFSDDISIYLSSCDEKVNFIAPSDLRQDVNVQIYESNNQMITAGKDLIVKSGQKIIFNGLKGVDLFTGFGANYNSNFYATTKGCKQPLSSAFVILPNSTTTTIDNIIAFSGFIQYSDGSKLVSKPVWSATGGTISSSGVYTATSVGTFSVKATIGNVSTTAQVTVVNPLKAAILSASEAPVEEKTDLVTALESHKLKPTSYYPNPIVSKLTIDIDSYNNYRIIMIYDIAGKLISQSAINEDATSVIVDFETIASGSYIVKLVGTQKSEVFKVIKN